jgi:hypothetical protein
MDRRPRLRALLAVGLVAGCTLALQVVLTYALSVVLFALLVFTGLGSLATGGVRSPRRVLVSALAVACLLIAAAAVGTAMPLGLARLAGLHASAVPWAWGINGVTSVLGSVLAVAVALTLGFRAVALLALGCYLVALAHAALGRWPDRPPAAQPSAAAEPASASIR